MEASNAAAAVRELQSELNSRLSELESYSIEQEIQEEHDLPALLKIALKNEVEASEIAAYWIPTTPELDIKLGFARQVGDEARHYRLIAEHLVNMGVPLGDFDPMAAGYSPLFKALQGLETTVERLSAGQFTREAIAVQRNEMFIRYLEHHGHTDLVRLYREEIQPDETHHHQLGVSGLSKLMTTPDARERARKAMNLTLSIADEMKKAAEKKVGSKTLPGC